MVMAEGEGSSGRTQGLCVRVHLYIFTMFLTSKYVSGVIGSNPETSVNIIHLRSDVVSFLDSPV